MSPVGGAGRDAGLSAQRTRLAWRRTATSAAAVALLAARMAVERHPRPIPVLLAACALAAWVVLVAVAYRRGRWLATSPPAPGRRALTAYALITVTFALLGMLLVLA